MFSEISPSWKDNRESWKVKAAALKGFDGAVITNQTTTTLTLDNTNNPKPTELLRVGDTIGTRHANGSTENGTVASKTDITVVLAAAPGTTRLGRDDQDVTATCSTTISMLSASLWIRPGQQPA